MFLAFLVALPVLLYQLWLFIVPGLTARERKWAIPFVAVSIVLFLLGALAALITRRRRSTSSSASAAKPSARS